MGYLAFVAAVGVVAAMVGLWGVWAGLLAASMLVGAFAVVADGDKVRESMRIGRKP